MNKKLISLCFTISFVISFWFIRFKDFAIFRDFWMTEKYEVLNKNIFFPQFYLQRLFNIWAGQNLEPELFWSIFMGLVFFGGVIFTTFSLLKIRQLLEGSVDIRNNEFNLNETGFSNEEKNYQSQQKVSELKKTSLNNLDIEYFLPAWLIASLYMFNPFTLERFLMGQMFVLLAHSLLVTCLRYVFWVVLGCSCFKKVQLGNLIRLLILLIILAGSAVQYFGFAMFFLASLLGFSAFFKLFKILNQNSTKDVSGKNKPTAEKPQKKINKSLILTLVLIFSTILILTGSLYFKYFNQQTGSDYYFESLTNSETRTQIIHTFSLKKDPNSNTNLLVKSLIGSGSWMSPLIETYEVEANLGFLKHFSYYYNPLLAVLLIGGGVGILILIWIKNWKNMKNAKLEKNLLQNIWFIVSTFLLLISLSLTFGYTNEFWQSINKLFFSLPFSYAYREGGKFYSLSLALFFMLIYSHFNDLSRQWQNKITLLLIFIFCSSLLPFIHLSNHLNYVDYPAIFSNLNASCTVNDKILFLPRDLYLRTSFSPRIFAVSPSFTALGRCPLLTGSYVSLDSNQKDTSNLILSANEVDLQLLEIQKKVLENPGQIYLLKEFLKKNDVNMLIIETNSKDMQDLNTALSSQFKLKAREKTVFVYEIN